MIRKIIFWAHLVSGVVAGVVILVMSVTGVLLTYEHQLIERANMKSTSSQTVGEQRITTEQAFAIVESETGQSSSTITLRSNPAAPYEVATGRRDSGFVDSYTGEFRGTGDQSVRRILGPISTWHRYIGFNGEGQAIGKAITGAGNVIFLFILVSGIYLWLPKIWNRASLAMRIWFKKSPANSKVRDYNWHHVFGFWLVLPLIIIVFTAMSFSYPAVKSSIQSLAGAEPAPRGGGQGQQGEGGMGAPELGAVQDGAQAEEPPRPPAPAPSMVLDVPQGVPAMSLDALLQNVQNQIQGGWYKITAVAPSGPAAPAEMTIAYTNAIQPNQVENWLLNPYTGEVVEKTGWGDKTTAQKADDFVRRGHTGEFYGIAGQTIAGLVTLFACIMVWTGIALAWRRLISPLLAKKKSNSASTS